MAKRLLFALAAAVLLLSTGRVEAQQDWSIQTYDVRINVARDSTLSVDENIVVDFGSLASHGIFRKVPYQYKVDSNHNRKTELQNVTVDDGTSPLRFTSSRGDRNLTLKIGDPNVEVTGVHRYHIAYQVAGALNPHGEFDELYWNVTGNDWDVDIGSASASVDLPGDDITQVQCFRGPTGSTTSCDSATSRADSASFSARNLGPGEGLTVDLAIRKGALDVPPLHLVEAKRGPGEVLLDIFRPRAVPAAIAAALVVLALAGIARAWWLIGRDRWYGDNYYLRDDAPAESDAPRPLFAHETIVVQYTPPELGGKKKRMRPAEVGLLVDERADTLDVSATIIDLAVRKFLRIEELPKEGIFGTFTSQDYRLHRLEKAEDELLPYEQKLRDALFNTRPVVDLSELKYTFHDDLVDVKEELYEAAVKKSKFFPADPDSVRQRYRLISFVPIVAGAALAWFLELWAHAGVIGLPVVFGGIALFSLARLMPRRTAHGWEVYRRCLGFRLYMVTAETDRQKFAEEANIFHEYLPYAIVYGCVKKWAQAFEGLDLERAAAYYTGIQPFSALVFAEGMRGFSTSLSGAMTATPGRSGMSGFSSGGSGFSSGGGFSGGGLGGGGGGRW